MSGHLDSRLGIESDPSTLWHSHSEDKPFLLDRFIFALHRLGALTH
jgi:hypothetical protein